ncbi:hypothetical protein B0O79_1021 [Flavobacteriaceae bacterium MAR_2009_75]|nr:hypothetical protein B0O79_1021 [Flavobacteriaceae bacterium MAR_2009_75]
MTNPEYFPLTNEQLNEIIKDATLNSIGYLQVTNFGGYYARVEKGVYTVEKNGHIEQIHKNRKALNEIFKKLIYRYQNFERKGFAYNFNRGEWRRHKLKT